MFVGCTLQGQELEHFIVRKTDETEHKSRTRAFKEQIYIVAGDASPCEPAVLPRALALSLALTWCPLWQDWWCWERPDVPGTWPWMSHLT